MWVGVIFPVNTVKLRENRRVERSRFHPFICENNCEKVMHPFTNKKAGNIPDMSNIKTLKPFQSGPDPRRNTKGRPKGSRNVRTVIMEILKEKVPFNGKMTRKDKVIVYAAFEEGSQRQFEGCGDSNRQSRRQSARRVRGTYPTHTKAGRGRMDGAGTG